MTLRVAIIADDLTGALDASAPFAARGISTCVAVTLEGLDAALLRSTQVVCVNTASREIAPEQAAQRVLDSAMRLHAAGFDIAFKKVDSRLKGAVGIEVAAAREGFRRTEALIAPAVPSQGRRVIDGHVIGRGVSEPINIAALIGLAVGDAVPDAQTTEELLTLVADDINWQSTLLVGASGLAIALATKLRPNVRTTVLGPPAPLLFAIGSHDPITLEQLTAAQQVLGLDEVLTHDGALPDLAVPDRGLIVRAQPLSGEDRAAVMGRFARSVATVMQEGVVASLLIAGGETAQTIFSFLSVDCLEVRGEALPGIPVSIARIAGRDIMVLTKSGGFGTSGDLTRLAQAAMAQPLGRTGTGDHA